MDRFYDGKMHRTTTYNMYLYSEFDEQVMDKLLFCDQN